MSDLGPAKDLLGDGSVHQAKLAIEKVDVAEGGLHRVSFVGGEVLVIEPGSASLAERLLAGGRPFRVRCSTACTWFLARVRCPMSCAWRDTRRRSSRVRSSPIHTAARNPA